ncbi:MAG: protein kinase [Actinomycetia bacterium]|nr:protein kinase [Actinomycetes bacterium]
MSPEGSSGGRAAAVLAGRYRLDARIGRGAMGEVWRARDLTLERDVAVKQVRLDGHVDSAGQERFRREAIAMAGVSHPNVVSVYDAGVGEELAYLVMELLEGPSCAELIAPGRALPLGEVERIGAAVARGLTAAHAAGVVHRDIKPGNIVLNRGVATIVDFGIARLEQESSGTLTAPQSTIGTAAYMSPEQALGKPVGPPGDVYSLGALIVALATGAPPFSTSNALALMRAHVDDPPPLLDSLRDDVSSDLVALVDQMLAKDPEQRPTADEVAWALGGAGAGAEAVGDLGAVGAGSTVALAVGSTVAPTVPERAVGRQVALWGLVAGLLVIAGLVLANTVLGGAGSAPPARPTSEAAVGPGTQAPPSPRSTDPAGRTGATGAPDETPQRDDDATGAGSAGEDPAPTPSEVIVTRTVAPTRVATTEPAPAAIEREAALRDVRAAIEDVADDESRAALTRSWQGASNGLQGANAERHLREVITEAEAFGAAGSISAAETTAVRDAIESVIATL